MIKNMDEKTRRTDVRFSMFVVLAAVSILIGCGSQTTTAGSSQQPDPAVSSVIESTNAAQSDTQVLVQMIIAEVTLDDGVSLSNWLRDLAEKSPDAHYNGKSQRAFEYSLTCDDASGLLEQLNALQSVEILSRPQILARDNQSATIELGQQVPVVTGDGAIRYEQVGTVLDVTPQIHGDVVEMFIDIEISSLSDSTVKTPSGVNATIINRRVATTRFSAQSGRTIAIGGIHTKIDQATGKRRLLLVTLTPYILYPPGVESGRQVERLRTLSELQPVASSK